MKQDRVFQVQTEAQRAMLSAFVSRQVVPFQAALGPLHEQRSLPQNARYWKILSLAADVTGYSAEEMHEFALCRYFGFNQITRNNPLTGIQENVRVPLKRSSARDKKEFAALMESTEAWLGTEFGCWLDADQS